MHCEEFDFFSLSPSHFRKERESYFLFLAEYISILFSFECCAGKKNSRTSDFSFLRPRRKSGSVNGKKELFYLSVCRNARLGGYLASPLTFECQNI